MIVSISTATTNVAYWKQERLILRKQTNSANVNVSMWTNAGGSSASPIATYKARSVSGTAQVDIDMTDYLRAYATATIVYLYDNYEQETYTINVTRKGLINPDSVLIPPHWPYAKIVPPDYMIGDAQGQQIKAEFYNFDDGAYSVSGASWQSNHRLLWPTSTFFDLYYLPQGASAYINKRYTMRARQCDRQYALVEWVSFTGITRRHIFEVVKSTTKTANAYSLLPTDSEYVEIKGRNDGFTLRLDNLNAYDLWYYSDILHSSNVRVSMNADSPTSADFERVQIADNKITIPDGNASIEGVLEISVNWKHYDAVAL